MTGKSRKRTSNPIRNRRGYTLRELPVKFGRTFDATLFNLSSHPQKLDKLLKPGEVLAVSIYGHLSLRTFGSSSLLYNYMMEHYPDLWKRGSQKQSSEELIDNIKILKFGARVKPGESEEETESRAIGGHRRAKAKEKKEREKMTKQIEEMAEVIAPPTKQNKRTRIELLQDVVAAFQRQQQATQKLQREMRKMQRAMNKMVKQATKSLPKKTAPKKTAVKKTAPKKKGGKQ